MVRGYDYNMGHQMTNSYMYVIDVMVLWLG
jgi:hypothetical protein